MLSNWIRDALGTSSFSLLSCLAVSMLASEAGSAAEFLPAVSFGAGDGPTFVAVGTLDGDDVDDLVVANAGSDDVSVLLGNGDGTFQAALFFAAGDGPASVAVGHFDGDTALDDVVAHGFFDVDMLAGLCAPDGHERMPVVRCGD